MCKFHRIIAAVLLLQTFGFITSTPGEKSLPFTPPAGNKISATSNTPLSNSSNHTASHNTEILTEGGQINALVKPATTHPHSRGREGENVLNEPIPSSSKAVSTAGVSPSPKIEILSSSPASSSTPSTPERYDIPILEVLNNASNISEHKSISPRKGVNLTDFIEHQSKLNVLTVKAKPKKPTMTISSDEEPYAPSHFQPISKSNSSTSQSIPKVPNFDMLNESNQGNTQKYVVPIVIVILSVPFVAILISILYKRGSEWWKYRHYRRMDFLINGMYDN